LSTGNVAVAADAAGNFMVTYTAGDETYTAPSCDPSDVCLFVRRSDANGASGLPFLIQDPTTTYVEASGVGDQVSNPEVASLAGGDFVVVWEGYDMYDPATGDGGDEGTFARRPVATGQPKGGYFRVNDVTAEYQGQYGRFTASGSGDGSFVIIFRDEYDDYAPGGNLRAQLFNDKGKEVGGEFGVSSEDYNGFEVEVAHAGDGRFMVVWTGDGVTGRVFGPDATPITDDFAVSGGSPNGWSPAIAASDQSFVVVWQAGFGSLVGQRFGLDGSELSGEFEVSPTGGHDSGVIGLPCENWFALGGLKPGQVAKRSYRYRDGQLDEGPCKAVFVKGEKSITVKCQGKGETTDFPYDLEVGAAEGTVHAVLDMGLYRFCSSFPPDGGADGSDGKKFKGRNAPVVACPP